MALPILSLQASTLGKAYSLNDQTDLILSKLKALNIPAIEGGHEDPKIMKQKLADHGMQYSAGHFAMSGKPSVPNTITYLQTVGAHDMCNSGINEWTKPGPQHFTDSIKELNAMGKAFKEAGVKFHYHNHAFEFDRLDNGKTGMEMLLAGLDPRYVDLCVDVAWVHRGGDDPAAFLTRHADRIGYLHLKDTVSKDDPEAAGWRPLGKGDLNWPPIIEAIKKLPHVKWAAIEQDRTAGDPWDAITTSRKFLKENFGW